MHILFFLSSLSAGGAERVASLLADAWFDRGFEVSVVTLASEKADFFPLAPGVRRVGLDAMADSSNRWQALRRNFRRLYRLRRTLTRLDPDVVIGFGAEANVLVLGAAQGLRPKRLVSERTDPSRHDIGRMWAGLRRLVYPWADTVVVQTEAVQAWMGREIPGATCRVIPNPVLPPVTERRPPPASGRTVVGMGRLSPEKGFDLLLAAFARVAPEFPDWRLEILGDGPLRQDLAAMAESLGIGGRVGFAGRVANSAERLGQADLFVLSSRYEGFPNALLEAMAVGLPAISFDCPSGPAAIIRQGLDGILVPEGDRDALAAALSDLMSDEGKRARLGQNARSVLERFGMDRILAQWEVLFDAARMQVDESPLIAAPARRPDEGFGG